MVVPHREAERREPSPWRAAACADANVFDCSSGVAQSRGEILHGRDCFMTVRSSGDAETAGPLLSRERVLIVEDEEPLRDLVRAVLESYGYTVTVADCASAAIEVWQNHRDEIDAVITDIVMPGTLDGREMAEVFLLDRPDLPVLFVSGYSLHLAGVAPLLGRGRSFLPKPFEAGTLVRALRGILDEAKT
jgi:CheY-like chemotaxis protein